MNTFDMELTRRYIKSYKQATKSQKSKILNEYCSLVECSRNAAKKRLKKAAKLSVLPRVLKLKRVETRGRPRKYTPHHYNLIEKVWYLSGGICAERIFPELSMYITELKKAGELNPFTTQVIHECRKIKLGTLKYIIATFPKKSSKKHKGNADIYKKVSIDANFRRFTKEPGNLEIDYVEHSGGNTSGTFAITGTYTDLFSQWTVRAVSLGKHLASVASIFRINEKKIPIKILRLHPDNCKATLRFLTESLEKGMKLEDLSRSRPYKSNDNAHVEQKNDDKVRKLVGYFRYDTREETKLLNELYAVEDLISNFFTPSAKLKSKTVDDRGRVVRREHDKPASPYRRLLRSQQVPKGIKKKLKAVRKELSLVDLRRRSEKILLELGRFRR